MLIYKILRGAFFFLALILASFSVIGVGLSPATGTAEFYSGFDESITYLVRGNSQSNSKIIIGISGPLSDYATLDKDTVTVRSGESATFNLRLVIPENHGLIGPQPLFIDVNEIPDADDNRMIVVTTGVQGRFTVFFPYPGKYLDITALNVPHIAQGQDTMYEWTVKSRGSENVEFDSVLTLYDSDNLSVASKSFARTMLVPQQEFNTKGSFDTKTAKPGQYKINLTIKYEETEKSSLAAYNIGEENVDLVEYSPLNLTAGQINQISVKVKSLWNSRLSDVYVRIDLPGTTTTTQTVQLNPFETKAISQYINVPDIDESKEVTANIAVFFNGKQRVFDGNFYLVKSEEDTNSFNFVYLIIGISVLLLLVLIFLLFYIVKDKKRKKT